MRNRSQLYGIYSIFPAHVSAFPTTCVQTTLILRFEWHLPCAYLSEVRVRVAGPNIADSYKSFIINAMPLQQMDNLFKNEGLSSMSICNILNLKKIKSEQMHDHFKE